MAWLRLYDTILDDPKIQMLSDRAFRMLVNLWCLAKRNGGKLTDDLNSLAFSLRMPTGKVRDTMQALISAKLIDRIEHGYEPHEWNIHQYQSDVSTERVKRFRERSKKPDETVTETPPDTDSEPETESEQKEVGSATAILARVCEILNLELRANPERITWRRQIEEMLRDGLDAPRIIAATEIARANGVTKLSYIRACAFKPPKTEQERGKRRESQHEQAARVGAELIAEIAARDGNPNHCAPDGSDDPLWPGSIANGSKHFAKIWREKLTRKSTMRAAVIVARGPIGICQLPANCSIFARARSLMRRRNLRAA